MSETLRAQIDAYFDGCKDRSYTNVCEAANKFGNTALVEYFDDPLAKWHW